MAKAWTDENFYWTPSEEGNITEVRVASEAIWTPGFKFNFLFIELI